jgi:hypothetical protein
MTPRQVLINEKPINSAANRESHPGTVYPPSQLAQRRYARKARLSGASTKDAKRIIRNGRTVLIKMPFSARDIILVGLYLLLLWLESPDCLS